LKRVGKPDWRRWSNKKEFYREPRGGYRCGPGGAQEGTPMKTSVEEKKKQGKGADGICQRCGQMAFLREIPKVWGGAEFLKTALNQFRNMLVST